MPAISTMRGTESRSGILSSHLEIEAHKESVKASRLKLPSTAEKMETVLLYQVSNPQQKRFADRIRRVIAQVYSDPRNLSASAFPGHQEQLLPRLQTDLISMHLSAHVKIRSLLAIHHTKTSPGVAIWDGNR